IDYVGCKRGKYANYIYIGNNCYYNTPYVISLILQVLGLEDEHNRFDRDTYVDIKYDNIREDLKQYFKIDNINKTETYGLSYDYGSILHGEKNMYSKNNKDTIDARNNFSHLYQQMIGQRRIVGFNDFKLVNLHYCNYTCSLEMRNKIKCYRSGYQNPNRCYECICPFPYTGDFCESFHGNTGYYYCPDREVIALNHEKLLYFSRPYQCFTLIRAINENDTIWVSVKVTWLSNRSPCSRGDNMFEVQYKKDHGVMGLCFCGAAPTTDIMSEGPNVMLIYYGYYRHHYVDVTYSLPNRIIYDHGQYSVITMDTD
uniref:Metalloendopeptidase n=1 Tax=Parastrongyloides trichosuri TaxID=131310 RepID=A0A0N4ZGT0_PARTI